MWWKLLLVLFVVLILNLKKEKSQSKFYSLTVVSDSSWVTSSVTQAWVKYYASQGIKFGRVVFAQYTWETDWGTSEIFKQNHNGYGMKYRRIARKYMARNPITGEIQYSLGIRKGHAYYKNHADSVKDFAQWQRKLLRSRPDVCSEEDYLQLLDDYNVSWCPNCRYAEDLTYTTNIRKRMQYLASL